MNKTIIYALIYISGVLISAFAQVLLKKSADIKKDNIIKEYLNFKTICSYSIFFVATLCSVFAYKYLPLSYGPVLGTLEYIFKRKNQEKKINRFIYCFNGSIYIFNLK